MMIWFLPGRQTLDDSRIDAATVRPAAEPARLPFCAGWLSVVRGRARARRHRCYKAHTAQILTRFPASPGFARVPNISDCSDAAGKAVGGSNEQPDNPENADNWDKSCQI